MRISHKTLRDRRIEFFEKDEVPRSAYSESTTVLLLTELFRHLQVNGRIQAQKNECLCDK